MKKLRTTFEKVHATFESCAQLLEDFWKSCAQLSKSARNFWKLRATFERCTQLLKNCADLLKIVFWKVARNLWKLTFEKICAQLSKSARARNFWELTFEKLRLTFEKCMLLLKVALNFWKSAPNFWKLRATFENCAQTFKNLLLNSCTQLLKKCTQLLKVARNFLKKLHASLIKYSVKTQKLRAFFFLLLTLMGRHTPPHHDVWCIIWIQHIRLEISRNVKIFIHNYVDEIVLQTWIYSRESQSQPQCMVYLSLIFFLLLYRKCYIFGWLCRNKLSFIVISLSLSFESPKIEVYILTLTFVNYMEFTDLLINKHISINTITMLVIYS